MNKSLDNVFAGLRCGDVLDRLPSYLDGSLATEARAAVENHLRQCRRCAQFGGAYGAVVDGLHALLNEVPAASTEETQRLQAALAAKLDQ